MELKSFENYLIEKQYSPGTIKVYVREISLFFFSLESQNQQAHRAKYADILDYLGAIRKQRLNPKRPLYAIKQYYAFLLLKGFRKDHPARSIKLRDQQRRDIQLQDLFSYKELELLLERSERYPLLKYRNKLIISFLIYQGLTNGEICGLSLRDIDLEESTIFIEGSRKTNCRTLKLHSKQIYWLMEYLRNDRKKLLKKESDCLIISKSGNPEKGEGIGYLLECQRQLFKNRILNAITIRQSVISNLLKEGKDLRMVQVFAGHKYPSATEQYRQTEVEALKTAILKHHPF